MIGLLPHFHPHPLLRNGHSQTLAGFLLFRTSIDEAASHHLVSLPDGDQIVLHDDCPPAWQPGDRTALLMHGLAGCHRSPYMQRIARKLNQRGVRTFRMDLRGCGAGELFARLPYHSGRSEDALAGLHKIVELCPGSPVSLVGFSLSGNIVLKLLGESPPDLPAHLDRAAAVSPPIDLAGCVEQLRTGTSRFYDRYFVRLLLQQIAARRRAGADLHLPEGWPGTNPAEATGASPPAAAAVGPAGPAPPGGRALQVPRGIYEFDAAFTAPLCGFGTAENYYRLCSSAQFIRQIRVPTLILTAADDPLVPATPFWQLALPSAVTLQVTEHGGHLGFIGRSTHVPDRRWMDWRIVDWLLA